MIVSAAACGRTAPSACDLQEVVIYVARADGLYLFDHKEHSLKKILAEDIRAITGVQEFTQDAPINLIYVVDAEDMEHPVLSDESKSF